MQQQQLPRRRLPSFPIPVPRFLRPDWQTFDDFLVLLRVTPQINMGHYAETLGMLATVFLVFVVLFTSLILYVQTTVFQNLLLFVWRDGWMLLAALLWGYVIPARLQIDALLFWLTVYYVAGLLWSLLQMRKRLRELRSLWAFPRMTPQQRSQVTVERLLRISLPTWLNTAISYDPRPEQFLALLREQEPITESQTQVIAALLSDDGGEAAEEESATIDLLLSLTHCASLSMLQPGGKQATVVFTDAVAPLLGFFGTRERGTWISNAQTFRAVYDPGRESAFGTHRTRIKEQILAKAGEAGFLPLEALEEDPAVGPESVARSLPAHDTQEQEEPTSLPEHEGVSEAAEEEETSDNAFTLLENRKEGQISSWRLVNRCRVEVYPVLTDFYPKVIASQALALSDDPAVLGLEQLRQGCHRVMEEYDEGFLVDHMKKGYIWEWALPLYRQYREQCLAILAYANQREQEHLKTCTTTQQKYEVVQSIAQLYGWQAFVAAGFDLQDGGAPSEHDMERCLYYYGKAKQRAIARAIYKRYGAFRSRFDPTYEPSEALKRRAEAIMHPPRREASTRTTREEH